MPENGEFVTGIDFVILSTQDWDALPTRKHRFSRWWAEDGNRVLYIEQQMHWAGWLVEIRRYFPRLWRWLQGPREVAKGLWVFTLPIVLPFFQMSRLINAVNNLFLRPVIKTQMKRLGFEAPVIWSYTPHSAGFVGTLNERAFIYECVDDFPSAKGLVRETVMWKLEESLIRKADLLITTHPALYEARKSWAKRAEVVPNGVDAEHLGRAADRSVPAAREMAGLRHPVIGYLGGINYWVDTELLARIARKHPDWSVVMVGPQDLLADMSPLEGLPNVILTGRVPYADVPDYVRAFDVCVNPYILDGIAEHCSPLKLYEYVATGKPVVSVDMPEAHRFEGLISIADDAESFVELVEKAVQSPDGRDAERIAEAQKHTWRGRYAAVSALLAAVLENERV